MPEAIKDDEQLKLGSSVEGIGPQHLWKTALGRAIFGFYCEAGESKYFVNDAYIKSLCETENNVNTTYAKLTIFSFAFSIFSITTANNALGDAEYLGFRISNIPYLTELCMLVLGFLVSNSVVLALDIHALTRMRIEIFSVTGSESPHMRMAHIKGNGAWIDALLPKRVGYSSNFVHRIFQAIALVWALMLPMSSLMVMFSALLVCALSVESLWTLGLSSLMAWAAIALALSSLIVLIIVAFVPLRFSLKDDPSNKPQG